MDYGLSGMSSLNAGWGQCPVLGQDNYSHSQLGRLDITGVVGLNFNCINMVKSDCYRVLIFVLFGYRTWSGPAWSPAQSLSSVLISIQSLLNEKPYHNEPGFEQVCRTLDKCDYLNRDFKIKLLPKICHKTESIVNGFV